MPTVGLYVQNSKPIFKLCSFQKRKQINDEIVLFLEKTIIKFKVLSDDEIMDLIRKYRINNLNEVLNKYKFTFKFNKL